MTEMGRPDEPGHKASRADASLDTRQPARPLPRTVLLILVIILTALNLRPALSSMGPVLAEIIRDTGLSPTGASWLTGLPVVCLGLSGLLAPRLAARWGTERVVVLMLFVLAVGLILRVDGGIPALFVSSAAVGAAIGTANVLLPGLLKRDFPTHAVVMTGVFTMSLCGGAALAAGVSVPLSQAMGGQWPLALGAWAAPAVLAALLWVPILVRRQNRRGRAVAPMGTPLWRKPVAWQVTLFMGLQSSLAYSVFAWLATILRDRGISPVDAGLLVSISVLAQVPAALFAPALMQRARDQRSAVVISQGLTFVGLMGCIFAPPEAVWMWTLALVLGVGQGASFSTALSLIVLRAGTSAIAARLSGMVQGIGYTVSAGGPFLAGVLHDATGGWSAVAVLFGGISGCAILFGLGAGRNRMINDG